MVTGPYNTWGYICNTSGTMAETLGKSNALRYRGYVYDTETALYYLQSRYYNPGTGRFINADALVATGQGLLGNNMFAYCLNNPVAFSDDTGAVAKVCLSADREIDAAPWRNYSPGGGSTKQHMKLSAEDLVRYRSIITSTDVSYNGIDCKTFFVSIHVNCFLGDDGRTIEQRVMAYTDALYRHLNDLKKDGVTYYTMSKQHIYSEIMAHIWAWIYIGYPNAEVIDLNVNESRSYVIFLMKQYGYNGEEEFG